MKELSLYETDAVTGAAVLSAEELRTRLLADKAAGCHITYNRRDVKPARPLIKFDGDMYAIDSVAKACNEGAADCMVEHELISSCNTEDYIQTMLDDVGVYS